eukprot:15339647-Ditylum_brightwellii.AAC.1
MAWHPLGQKFTSAGMDTTVKLWLLEEKKVKDASEASYDAQPRQCTGLPGASDKIEKTYKKPFRTIYENMLTFSTNKVHTDNNGGNTQNQRLRNNVIALREFSLKHCGIWFIRFNADADCHMLATGNNR